MHVKRVNMSILNNTYTQPFDESSPCTSCDPCHRRMCAGSSWSDCIFLCLAQAASPTHAQNDPSCLQGYQCFQFAEDIMNTNNSNITYEVITQPHYSRTDRVQVNALVTSASHLSRPPITVLNIEHYSNL